MRQVRLVSPHRMDWMNDSGVYHCPPTSLRCIELVVLLGSRLHNNEPIDSESDGMAVHRRHE